LQALHSNQDATDAEKEKAQAYFKQISNGNFDYQDIMKQKAKAKREKREYQPQFT